MTAAVSPLDDYLFDLRGYLHLEGAVNRDLLRRLNAAIDALPPIPPDGWHGNIHNRAPGATGVSNFHNILEVEPFEQLIDHPSWIGRVERYVGGDDGLFIDESFVNVRGPGQATNLHSGGDRRRIRTQFRYHDGRFRCGQINVLLPLEGCGPGDGATMVIPGSHKSNLPHPQFEEQARSGRSLEDVAGAAPLYTRAGDALLFVDCIAHGSARRTSPGQRRFAVLRYGPHWGHDRYGYRPSPEFLARLTPARRRIIQPIPPLVPPAR